MPRFYISFRNEDQTALDDEGQDFPGFAQAREAALSSAREILADNIKSRTSNPLHAVVITDENCRTVETISAGDVLPEHLTKAWR